MTPEQKEYLATKQNVVFLPGYFQFTDKYVEGKLHFHFRINEIVHQKITTDKGEYFLIKVYNSRPLIKR